MDFGGKKRLTIFAIIGILNLFLICYCFLRLTDERDNLRGVKNK